MATEVLSPPLSSAIGSKKIEMKIEIKATQLPLLLYHLLSEYNKRIAQSDESNRKKRNVFSKAKKYLAVGVSLTVSVILLPFLAEAVPKAQAWLAAYDL